MGISFALHLDVISMYINNSIKNEGKGMSLKCQIKPIFKGPRGVPKVKVGPYGTLNFITLLNLRQYLYLVIILEYIWPKYYLFINLPQERFKRENFIPFLSVLAGAWHS